jgi:spore germination protein YaaH
VFGNVGAIRIMAYDFSVAEPGPIAPLYWVEQVIEAATDEVDDRTKLWLGVPLYGRNWLVSTAGTCPADAPQGTQAVNQRTVDDLIERRGVTPVRDENAGESSFVYDVQFGSGDTLCTQTRRVHWVDAQGAFERLDLARRKGLGGGALWALGFDDEATWTAIDPIVRPVTEILVNASMLGMP